MHLVKEATAEVLKAERTTRALARACAAPFRRSLDIAQRSSLGRRWAGVR